MIRPVNTELSLQILKKEKRFLHQLSNLTFQMRPRTLDLGSLVDPSHYLKFSLLLLEIFELS